MLEQFVTGSVVRLTNGRTGLITRILDHKFSKVYCVLLEEQVVFIDVTEIVGVAE